jgi:hypothetical protein
MHSFHSVPVVFAIGLGDPGVVEYQLSLSVDNDAYFTMCIHPSIRSAVEHARYDEVNFSECRTRILVHIAG